MDPVVFAETFVAKALEHPFAAGLAAPKEDAMHRAVRSLVPVCKSFIVNRQHNITIADDKMATTLFLLVHSVYSRIGQKVKTTERDVLTRIGIECLAACFRELDDSCDTKPAKRSC